MFICTLKARAKVRNLSDFERFADFGAGMILNKRL